MAVETKLMTAEELWRMPDDGMRHELVEGELTTMSPAGARHGDIALVIGAHLRAHVAANNLGKAYAAETGFQLTTKTVKAAAGAELSRTACRFMAASTAVPTAALASLTPVLTEIMAMMRMTPVSAAAAAAGNPETTRSSQLPRGAAAKGRTAAVAEALDLWLILEAMAAMATLAVAVGRGSQVT